KDVKKLPHLTPEQLASFDAKELEANDMTEVGSGVIDWKRIFSRADEAGIQHYFVEHDSPKDPFASIAASYKYLSTLRCKHAQAASAVIRASQEEAAGRMLLSPLLG